MKTVSKVLSIIVISAGMIACGGEQAETTEENNNAAVNNDVVVETVEEPETVEDYMRVIRADDEWMTRIEEKATERGVTIDEMVKMDAEWIVNEKKKNAPKTVESVLETMKNNEEWLKQIEWKAAERGISLEEMMVIEAEYVVAQQNK